MHVFYIPCHSLNVQDYVATLGSSDCCVFFVLVLFSDVSFFALLVLLGRRHPLRLHRQPGPIHSLAQSLSL